MRGPRRVSQSSGGAVAGGLAAQSRAQEIANAIDRTKQMQKQLPDAEAKRVPDAEAKRLLDLDLDAEVKKILAKSRNKIDRDTRDTNVTIKSQDSKKEEEERKAEIQKKKQQLQREEQVRRDRLLMESEAFQAQLAKEKAEEKARREAEAKARHEAEEKAQAQELGKRKREVEQDSFLTNSWKNVAQWASSLTANLGGSFSLPNPFAPQASAPISVTNSPPPISKAPIIINREVEEFRRDKQEQRPPKKQKTDIEPIQMPKSTPSDHGQYYLDGLYKRFNNGDNNFNIQTIINEKDMSVMGGHEQNRVSYLNQRVAKWESELNKFGITQPKKIQTDDVVDLRGNKIKRDDYLIQYGDYLKENIKTLRNEATNNSGSKDRNNKLNHLIAFHYLELAKMVCAGSNGLHNNLTDIPSQYKDFLEYSVGDSKFISTDSIQKPISVKTTDLGSRALRDIKYLEADIYKKLTGKETNICTLGISVPFDQVAYRNQVEDITKRITRDPETPQKKSPQQKLDELKERSQAAANKGSLAERYLPRALSEIVSSNSYGQQKQAPFTSVFDRAAPASRIFTQMDARNNYLNPNGLGYRNPSTYAQDQDRKARRDLNILQQLNRENGMTRFREGAQAPGGSGRGGGR